MEKSTYYPFIGPNVTIRLSDCSSTTPSTAIITESESVVAPVYCTVESVTPLEHTGQKLYSLSLVTILKGGHRRRLNFTGVSNPKGLKAGMAVAPGTPLHEGNKGNEIYFSVEAAVYKHTHPLVYLEGLE